MAEFPTSIPTNRQSSPSEYLSNMASGFGHVALHNFHINEIIALATKLGTGASVPASGQVLRGTGAGASAWGKVDLTADVTGSLPVANGGTGATSASGARTNLSVYSSTEVDGLITAVKQVLYPVGSIYTNASDNTNPGTLLGFGTWTAFGTGRVLVGIDSGQTEFDTIGETGGAKTHTLTIAEMPAHTHTVASTLLKLEGAGASFAPLTTGSSVSSGSAGGGGAHNNLQPYVVVYMWQRTA